MTAASVGLRELDVVDGPAEEPVRAWLMYPAAAAPSELRIGPFVLSCAPGAPAAGHDLPLVVISHGSGSTPWAYRNLGAALATAGWCVALVEHPGDHRGDPSRSGTEQSLRDRPSHLRRAIDAALRTGWVSEEGVAVVGHSMGGCTALALAGGRAMTLPDDVGAADRLALDEATRRRAYAVETETDARVTAAVLLAPALGFFLADGALADVDVPLLVRTAEHDDLCPTDQVRAALRSLPGKRPVDVAEVPNAGHFAWLSPFPPQMAAIPPAQDPPGFDRGRYHAAFHRELLAFLGRAHIAAR